MQLMILGTSRRTTPPLHYSKTNKYLSDCLKLRVMLCAWLVGVTDSRLTVSKYLTRDIKYSVYMH